MTHSLFIAKTKANSILDRQQWELYSDGGLREKLTQMGMKWRITDTAVYLILCLANEYFSHQPKKQSGARVRVLIWLNDEAHHNDVQNRPQLGCLIRIIEWKSTINLYFLGTSFVCHSFDLFQMQRQTWNVLEFFSIPLHNSNPITYVQQLKNFIARNSSN